MRSAVLLAAMTLGGCASAGRTSMPTIVSWTDTDLDTTLSRHVTADGFVRYDALAADHAPLDRYVARLAEISPDSHPALFPTRAHELAYWMNAYNALMLHRVVRAWPVDSVRTIRIAYGVFWIERHELGGRRQSLRKLENAIIRERYGDPRIHFAINCASRGCPALPQRAWRASTLEHDLETAARRFVANPANVRYDPRRGVVELSSIFDWFEDDFLGWMSREGIDAPHGLTNYVARYVHGERVESWGELGRLRIEFTPYDWSINAAPPVASDAPRSTRDRW